MNADRLSSRIAPAFILILALAWVLPACAPASSPPPFHAPSRFASPTPLRVTPQSVSPTPTILPTTAILPAPTKILPCANNLTFLGDLTYKDNAVVSPNQVLDKQWSVQNSGTCDWDARYRLVFIGGDLLGAPAEILLYPARAGAQATVRVAFFAPFGAGTYQSQWQAEGPDGTRFGDPLYIQIIVNQ